MAGESQVQGQLGLASEQIGENYGTLLPSMKLHYQTNPIVECEVQTP